MRLATLCIVSTLAFSPAAWPQQTAKDGDPTPRKGIDPIDAATVKQFEARRWIDFGLRAGANGAAAGQVRSDVAGAIPGQRSCITQIGPAAGAPVGPGGQGVDTPRFGQRKDSPVIITGSVINVCR